MDKNGGLRLKSLFCWRYLGLTGIERPAYDVAISFGLPSKPEASSAPDDLAPRLERVRQLEEAYALILRTAPQWPFSRTTLSYLGAINFLGLTSTILGIALTIQRVFRI